MTTCRILMSSCLTLSLLPTSTVSMSWAQEDSTGRIIGRIVWDGKTPKLERLENASRLSDATWVFSGGAPVLSRWQISEHTLGVGGIYVYLTTVNNKPGKAFHNREKARITADQRFRNFNGLSLDDITRMEKAGLDQLDFPGHTVRFHKGRHVPKVVAIQDGEPLLLVNCDRIGYGADYYGDDGRLQSHLLKPASARILYPSIDKRFDVVCPIHPWMKLSVRVFPHKWYAVTDCDGHFAIEDVPIGLAAVAIEHVSAYIDPTSGQLATIERTRDLNVAAGVTTNIGDVPIDGKRLPDDKSQK